MVAIVNDAEGKPIIYACDNLLFGSKNLEHLQLAWLLDRFGLRADCELCRLNHIVVCDWRCGISASHRHI